MAIIRIKRTTTNNLPTGLTFGELAFIGASGGATAYRLYIADNAGVCVWIGAQILNAPTFWSGATAQTTIPTVEAVDTRISGSAVTSYNGLTGSVQGVSAIGATSASSWQKLAVSFTNAYATRGATGYVNILGATWADSTVTNAGTVGGIANGTDLSGKTVFEILQNLLFTYQNVSFASSAITSGTFTTGNLELGQTSATSGNYTFSWTVNNSSNVDTNGMTVIYTGGGGIGSGTVIGATAYLPTTGRVGNLAINARGLTIGSSFSMTGQASQWTAYQAAGGSSIPTNISTGATATSSLGTATWYSKIYFGYTTGTSITSQSQLVSTGMGQNERLITQTSTSLSFANGSGTTLAFTPASGGGSGLKYLYVLVHDYYGAINNWYDSSNNLQFGMTGNGGAAIGATLSITNAQGFAANYKVYRSAEATDTSYISIYSG